MKETFIPILVLLIVYLVLSLNYQKESFEAQQKYQKRKQSINTSEVLNPEINPQIYKIARSLIGKINRDLKVNYRMGKFDNVIEDSDNEGNPRYVMDFFVFQINSQLVNDVNRRLIADVTFYPQTQKIQINTLNFSNAIKDQGPKPFPIQDDLAESLVIKPELTGQDYNPSGGPHLKSLRGTLEYGHFDSPAGLNLSQKCRGEYQDWLLPHYIQERKDLRRFPCQDYGDWWDADGVPLTKSEENGLKKLGVKCSKNFRSELRADLEEESEKISRWCYDSHNTATVPQYVNGVFYPNHADNPPNRYYQKNHWLFKADNAIMGFPHGSSNKTGY